MPITVQTIFPDGLTCALSMRASPSAMPETESIVRFRTLARRLTVTLDTGHWSGGQDPGFGFSFPGELAMSQSCAFRLLWAQ